MMFQHSLKCGLNDDDAAADDDDDAAAAADDDDDDDWCFTATFVHIVG